MTSRHWEDDFVMTVMRGYQKMSKIAKRHLWPTPKTNKTNLHTHEVRVLNFELLFSDKIYGKFLFRFCSLFVVNHFHFRSSFPSWLLWQFPNWLSRRTWRHCCQARIVVVNAYGLHKATTPPVHVIFRPLKGLKMCYGLHFIKVKYDLSRWFQFGKDMPKRENWGGFGLRIRNSNWSKKTWMFWDTLKRTYFFTTAFI